MKRNSKGRSQDERKVMPAGGSFHIHNIEIINDSPKEEVGRGGSCLVYYGHITGGNGLISGTKVIIKEFYPKLAGLNTSIFREKFSASSMSEGSDTGLNGSISGAEFLNGTIPEGSNNGLNESISGAEFLNGTIPEGRNIGLDESISREESGQLQISELIKKTEEYQSRKAQFMQGLRNQKKLSDSQALEIGVKPFIEGEWGDSYYVVSDVHQGVVLSEAQFGTLEERIIVAVKVIECLDILHENGCLMLDMKPENFLWIHKPAMVRILDVDSLINLNKEAGEPERLFRNNRYAAPEIEFLEAKAMEASRQEFFRYYKKMLSPQTGIYMAGIYFFQLFFGRMPEEKAGEKLQEEILAEEFLSYYAQEKSVEKDTLRMIGESLVKVIKKMTMSRPKKRSKSAGEVMEELNQILYRIAAVKLIPKKQVAKANASFLAYNMMQKYPLFHYASVDEKNILQLKVALSGQHEMRREFLSALISVGQMLSAQLHIYLIDEAAELFWKEYTGEDNNYALKGAVLCEQNGRMTVSEWDRELVSRPLATIHFITEKLENKINDIVRKEQCRYFILMDEDEKINQKNAEKIAHLSGSMEKQFIAFFYEKESLEGKKTAGNTDIFPISTLQFSENYNERMFKEKIYEMGLLAHAYYNGFMEPDAEVDMEWLEKEFRKDIYNIQSSERCAIHSIYKMASVGIDRKKPGRIRNYFRKISNEEVLEQLSWLEHLSWSAYMLTSGAYRIPISSLDTYAYMQGNDWKNKENPQHIGHPLLVSSKPGSLLNTKYGVHPAESLLRNWKEISEKEAVKLDELDRASLEMVKWYLDHKKQFQERWEQEWLKLEQEAELLSGEKRSPEAELLSGEKRSPEAELLSGEKKCQEVELLSGRQRYQIPDVFQKVRESGQVCIDQMEARRKEVVKQWETSFQKMCDYIKEENLPVNPDHIKTAIQPVLDYYKERDYKVLDRDMVWASLDMSGEVF